MSGEGAYELLQEGRRLIQRGENIAAVPLLELAKHLEPRKGSILEALGQAYFNSYRPERASLQFVEALELDPTNHWAHYCLSCCLSLSGRLAEAIGHLKMAVAMEPANESYRETLRRFRFRLALTGGA